MSFKNTIGQREEKRKYVNWAKGQMLKKQKVFHPYLDIDFKFDNEKK